MSLDTYGNLQTAVLRHIARPGDSYLQAALPDMVALCEGRINYGSGKPGDSLYTEPLRTTDMETRVTATLADEYEDLPGDWLEMRALKLLTTPQVTLDPRSPVQFEQDYPGGLAAGMPRVYTITGGQLRLGPPPAGGHAAEMTYYARVPALGPAQPTNWLLTKAPAVYLYGTLLELAGMLKADPTIWLAQFVAAIGGLQHQAGRALWSGGSLQMRTDAGNAP